MCYIALYWIDKTGYSCQVMVNLLELRGLRKELTQIYQITNRNMFILCSLVVTIHATMFNVRHPQFCAHCVFVFHITIYIGTHYFPTQF